jgi:hypothetical protein
VGGQRTCFHSQRVDLTGSDWRFKWQVGPNACHGLLNLPAPVERATKDIHRVAGSRTRLVQPLGLRPVDDVRLDPTRVVASPQCRSCQDSHSGLPRTPHPHVKPTLISAAIRHQTADFGRTRSPVFAQQVDPRRAAKCSLLRRTGHIHLCAKTSSHSARRSAPVLPPKVHGLRAEVAPTRAAKRNQPDRRNHIEITLM